MRLAAVLAVCVCSCYSPTYKDCEITCASGSCPSGFSCEQGVCRVAGFSGACGVINGDGGVDGPPDDPDGDGIKAGDNCPNVANPDQYDEDGDGMGDACDPCPPFGTSTANHDSDGDGVGDGCDPSPITVGNTIILFAGFQDSAHGGAVTPANHWAFANGQATVTSTATPSTYHLITWSLPTGGADGERLITRFKVNSIGTTFPNGAGFVTQWDLTNQQGVHCVAGKTSSTTGNLQVFETNNPTTTGLSNDPFTAGTTYNLTFTRNVNNFSCAEPNAVGGMTSTVSALRGANAGLAVKDVDVTFDWVMIVGGQ